MGNTSFNTIFDDVFRTIAEKMPFLMIPLINEVFHTDYPEDLPFESLRNEHHESAGTIVTDSLFKIEDFLYHMECQSKRDGTMAIRMFQYDAAIAIEHATQTADDRTDVYFPKSCVLYIRNHRKKEEQHSVNVHFADGQTIDYHCPVIYAQNYTVDRIFEKRLLLLLPYHILRYEHFLKSNKNNKKKIKKLLEDYTLIRKQLDQTIGKEKNGTLYHNLIRLINQIADYIIPSKNPIKGKVEDVMGGKVLKLWSEELLEEGEARGLKKGEALGIKKGEALGLKKGEALGLKKGEAQGKLDQTIKIILDFLTDFGKLPDSLCEKIKSQTNLEILNGWVRIARYAVSIEDFVQKIETQQ